MRLNLNCPINTTSYGYVSSYFMKELLALGNEIMHIPIGQNTPDADVVFHVMKTLSRPGFFHDAACLKIWHQNDLKQFFGSGKKIGFPIFELENFKPEEISSLRTPDELIVCSDWARSVIEASVPEKNTHVVPLGYNDEIFKQTDLPYTDCTIFGNFGKWDVRKGHDVLVEIFNKAFEPSDNVMLVMMPHNFFNSAAENNYWENKYKSSKLSSKIQLLGRQSNQRGVYDIMSQVHCGIFPSRAEGWNLEALEMLACGRHLIITNATAHTQFCNASNSMLIDVDEYESAYDGKWFDGTFLWRKLGKDQIDQAIEYMRLIHKRRVDGQLSLNLDGIASAKAFSWKESALKLNNLISSLIGN